MAIELATKYLPYVDELFSTESKKSLVTNNDFDWTGAHTIKIYKIGTADMTDYGRSGPASGNWSRYGAVQGLDATTEEMTLTKDRSFTFAVDKLDIDETERQLAASSALARQLRQVTVPEVDSYTFGKICEGAGHKPAAVELNKSNIYEEIIKGNTALDNAEAPESGRVLIVTPDVYLLLKQNRDIILETDIGNDLRLKGVIAMLDGLTVVKVPAARMPKGFGFLIVHPVATVAPTKLEDYKIHEDPPGISGSLVEGRIAYDAFVLDNKAKAIYYQAIAAGGLTVTSESGSSSGATKVTVTPTAEDGNSYRYKVGAAVDLPSVGENCSEWSTWNGTADIIAATGKVIVVVEVDSDNNAVKAGSAKVTAK